VDYMIARLYLQPVDQRSQKAGVTVVKQTTWIDRHEDIVIELFRICILRRPVPSNPGLLTCQGPGPRKCSRGTLANALTSASDCRLATARNSSA
jgi:hypothetical protein